MDEMNEANLPAAAAEPRKRGTLKFYILAVLALLAAAYVGLCFYAHSLTVFYPGYTINGLSTAGLTAPQAQQRLQQDFPTQAVTLRNAADGEVLSELTLTDLGVTAETSAGWAENSMALQRSAAFLRKGYQYLFALTGYRTPGSVYPCDLSQDTLFALAKRLEADLYLPPVHTAYALTESALSITIPADGRTLDAAALAAALQALPKTVSGPREVFISFETLPAQRISAQDIYNAVAGEMQNAAYDKESGTITAEKTGVQFPVASAQAAMDGAAPGTTILVPAQITPPEITADFLVQVLFRDVLGEATTHVSGTAARISNVKLAAQAINGTVLNPGEVFSYNEALGERTAARGYQPAPAYIRGETVDEIGGGICQTSSTLYLACLRGNLAITERYAHRFVPAYIAKGMDATVSWGGPDYKFTNDTDFPVMIVASYAKNYLTVQMVGTNLEGTYAKVVYEQLSQIPWETVYEEDPTLAPGSPEVEKTSPYTGYKVRTYHTIYAADGTVLDTHYEATSDYKVRNRVILRPPAAVTEPEAVVPGMGEAQLPSEGGTFTPLPGEPEEPDIPAFLPVPDVPEGE